MSEYQIIYQDARETAFCKWLLIVTKRFNIADRFGVNNSFHSKLGARSNRTHWKLDPECV